MQTVDPITVEVIHNYLLSAAREMNRNLMRTAYNTIVYEVRDFGLGLYDRHCRLLAEAPQHASLALIPLKTAFPSDDDERSGVTQTPL